MKELILLKLPMLVFQFEDIKMLEDETFNEFFGKLNDIRNFPKSSKGKILIFLRLRQRKLVSLNSTN